VSTANAVVYWFVPLFDKRPVRPLRGKEVSSSCPDLLRSILLGFPEVEPIHLVSLLFVFHIYQGERMSLVLCVTTLSEKNEMKCSLVESNCTEDRVCRVARMFLAFMYLLTPRSRVLLEELTGSQLVMKFHAFYGTRTFITAFTSARHLSQSSLHVQGDTKNGNF
jgi:hypothetical protein